MPTLGEFADRQERDVFVGRVGELTWFRQWLAGEHDGTALLNVRGHAGVGKTALLRRFRAVALELGQQVRFLDGHDVGPNLDGLVVALGEQTLDAAVEQLNGDRRVLLVDSLDVTPALARPLFDQLLPRLSMPVRVVVAGRWPPLPQGADHPLSRVTRFVRLDPFTETEARRYLDRRRIHDPDAVSDVLAATRGNPLAASMAADVLSHEPAAMLQQADWDEALRGLTQRLMRGLPAGVQRLVEASATVRQFDEDLLEALVDETTVSEAFPRLATLSMVRPGDRRLRLHDDVRGIVARDLKSRRPAQARELRDRALGHFRHRLQTAGPREREWLVNEQLYLWEHDFIQNMLFPAAASDSDLAIHQSGPADREKILDLWKRFAHLPTGPQGGAPTDDVLVEEVEALIDHPASRFLIATDGAGVRRAVGLEMRIGQDSLDVLPAVVRHVVDSYFRTAELPAQSSRSPYRYLGPIVGEPGDDIAMANLARAAIGSWIHGGVLVIGTTMSGYAALLEMLGFARMPLDVELRQRHVHALTLELEGGDVQDWIERITGALPDVGKGDGGEPVDVTLLGRFAVSRGGKDVTPTKVAAAAVKHVAVSGGALHVEELVERLWPGTDIATGRARLRSVLSRLRLVSGDVVVRDGDLLRVGPGIEVDASSFSRDVARARTVLDQRPSEARDLLRSALQHYGGDLLPGDVYVDEFVVPRERLRTTLLQAWDAEADAAAALSDVEGAVLALDRGIEIEPYDEHRYLTAARLLHATGQTGRGFRYLRRARTLSREFDFPLSPTFRAVEQSLLA